MRVNLEPQADPSIAAAAAATPPQRHKPLLQARRNQYEDYRNLKDRDFLSIHEEVTHLRQTSRDQERIIALLKEEKNRVLSDLLQKGKELQAVKDLLKKPQSSDEKSQLEDMKRTLADREANLDDMKSEVIRLNGVHQKALEDYDEVLTELRMMEQRVLNAEQVAEHKTADAQRMQETIDILNEEMQSRVNALNKELSRAAEIGKRDASTESTMLQEELESYRKRFAEAQVLVKKHQEDELRQREMAIQQQQAANEAMAEKVTLLAELRRQQLLLGEVDDLKAQIEAFRLSRATSEEVLRQKLNVALLEIHEEKEMTRQLMKEVDTKEDTIAEKDREIHRLTREFDKSVETALEGHQAEFKAKLREMDGVVDSALREKAQHSEAASRAQSKLDNTQTLLKAAERDIERLTADLTVTVRQRNEHQTRIKELEDAVAAVQRALSGATEEITRLRQTQQSLSNEELSQRDEVLRRYHEREEKLIAEKQLLQIGAAEAIEHISALEIQVEALRSSQTEHDAVRHTQLAEELEAVRERNDELEAAVGQALGTIQSLQKSLDASTKAAARLQGEQQHSTEAAQSERTAIMAKVAEAESNVAEGVAANASLQEQLHRAKEEATAVAFASPELEKRIEKLEKEKKILQDKLKMSDVAREDADKSLELRGSQLRKESELRREQAVEVSALKATVVLLEKASAEQVAASQRERQDLSDRHDTVSAELQEKIRLLGEEVVLLREENAKMKEIQLHW